MAQDENEIEKTYESNSNRNNNDVTSAARDSIIGMR